MVENQEGVNYRSIFADLLKDPADVDLALQIARKILILPRTPSQLQQQNHTEQEGAIETIYVPPSQPFAGQFYGKSQTEAAAEILKMARTPQKTRAILEAMNRAEFKVGGRNPEGTMYRALLRSKGFLKVAPDTWGLAEWYPGARLKPPVVPGKRRKKKRAIRGKRISVSKRVPKSEPIEHKT